MSKDNERKMQQKMNREVQQLQRIIVDLEELESLAFLPHQIEKLKDVKETLVHDDAVQQLQRIIVDLEKLESLAFLPHQIEKLKDVKETLVHGGGTGDN